ncbi:MAG: trigger factor [Gammaproteobacteria bacterium]|nr:trigger factor [Gammaproteobacteria bacterium]MYK68650.1 trigger factor [Gammaproteobacteria bacterium]
MTIDPTRLRVSVTEGERWRRDLAITVPADIVGRERARVMDSVSGRARMPGFRKGRIPARVLEQRYGAAVEQETLETLLNEATRAAIRSEQLRPISDPEVGAVRSEPGEDLFFEISFDVEPRIEIERSGGFVVERPAVEVGDAEVDAVLLRLRQQNGAWRPLEGGLPDAGNAVGVNILQLDREDAEARDYEFILGEGDAIPDVERAIEQLEVGTEGDFVVRFPDDFPNEERRGEEERLRIRLVSRKVLDLPELDDDFAASLDFTSLDDLQDKVRADLEQNAAGQAEQVIRARLMEFVLEANAFDAPGSMVDRYLEAVAGEGPEDTPPEKVEEMKAAIRPRAERAVRTMLAVESLAQANDLVASPLEVSERVGEIARRNAVQPETVEAQLRRNGRMESLEREITEGKVFEFLKQQSEIIQAG